MTEPKKLTPVYEDLKAKKPISVNKITLAPHSEREATYLLKPHVGREGRRQDAELFLYLAKFQEANGQDEAFKIAMTDMDTFEKMAFGALDLDLPENQEIADNVMLIDLFNGMMDAMPFRSGHVNREDVEAAEKN
jgi:hypothetical protein